MIIINNNNMIINDNDNTHFKANCRYLAFKSFILVFADIPNILAASSTEYTVVLGFVIFIITIIKYSYYYLFYTDRNIYIIIAL